MAITEIFRRLHQIDARYVLIGSTALLIHGIDGAGVGDLDIAVPPLPSEVEQVIKAFADAHPRVRVVRSPSATASPELPLWTVLETSFGELDILTSVPGVPEAFEGLFARSHVLSVEGVPIRFASLDDLALMKQASTRPVDKLHLEMIREVQRLAGHAESGAN